MIKTSATVSLVPHLRGGPWIYWDGLEDSCAKAAAAGFDAIELFALKQDDVDPVKMRALMEEHGLLVGATGTGAGKVVNGWTITDPDEAVRTQAISFIKSVVDAGSEYGAMAIIGSMQGNVPKDGSREQSLEWLGAALTDIGKHAGEKGMNLIYEPLNRYESNLFNRVGDAAEFTRALDVDNVVLLADLFHMNIEESDVAQALVDNADAIGYIHYVDSNRRVAGFGHTDFDKIKQALIDMKYDGYVSVEGFDWPNPDAAAEQAMKAFRQYLP